MKILTYQTISASTFNALSLSEIKDHLKLKRGDTREDDSLKILRSAAEEKIEEYTNRKITAQTLKIYLDDFPNGDFIDLPFPPLRSIPSSGLVYKNSTGESVQFSSTKWEQDIITEPGRVVLNYNDDWPTGITLSNNNPISIEINCGYSTQSTVPNRIKQAMLMTIASWYEGREDYLQSPYEYKRMPIGAKFLLDSLRIKRF